MRHRVSKLPELPNMNQVFGIEPKCWAYTVVLYRQMKVVCIRSGSSRSRKLVFEQVSQMLIAHISA